MRRGVTVIGVKAVGCTEKLPIKLLNKEYRWLGGMYVGAVNC